MTEKEMIQKLAKQGLQLEVQARKMKQDRMIQGGLFYILKKAEIMPTQSELLAAISMWKAEEGIPDELEEEIKNDR